MSPPSDPSDDTASSAERRRTGRIVHDERGNARLEWVSVPGDSERVPLSVEDGESAYKPERGYDPYQKAAKGLQPDVQPDRPAKRDLRKLSEWIKQMRDLEARKQQPDDPDE